MAKITSAYANKMLKSLEEDKEYWLSIEKNSSTYVASLEEEPVIPEYDFAEISRTISEIDEKVAKIKHALNIHNATSMVTIEDKEMSVDTILIRMAQLNRRKFVLDEMRKRLPKARVNNQGFGSRNAAPEYCYINYDLKLVKAEYENVSRQILEMQMALDKFNQTVEFELEI